MTSRLTSGRKNCVRCRLRWFFSAESNQIYLSMTYWRYWEKLFPDWLFLLRSAVSIPPTRRHIVRRPAIIMYLARASLVPLIAQKHKYSHSQAAHTHSPARTISAAHQMAGRDKLRQLPRREGGVLRRSYTTPAERKIRDLRLFCLSAGSAFGGRPFWS